MKTLPEMIRESASTTPADIVAEIFEALKVSNTAAEVLFPAVFTFVQHEIRLVDRVHEPAPGRVGVTAGSRTAFLNGRFALGDGRMVSWNEATVADHEQRIAFLRLMANGIMTTIARHEDAISAIIEAGVTCLGDLAAIPPEVAA